MSDMTQKTDAKPGWLRNLPFIGILVVAAIGAFTLKDYFSFDALRDNREALIALRATLGATAIFLAARYGFGDKLGAKLESSDGAVKKIKDGIDENQWSMLFIIRLVPAVPFFLANLIPAFLEVPLYRYVIATFFGIIPGTFVFTSVGAGLGEVFAAGETPNLGIIFEPHILFPILGLCVLAVLPVIIKAVRGKKGL